MIHLLVIIIGTWAFVIGLAVLTNVVRLLFGMDDPDEHLKKKKK